MDPMNGGGACRGGREGRHHFQVVPRGRTVSMSRCWSEDPKWQLLLHSGDPRTIHFPADDEQAEWDVAPTSICHRQSTNCLTTYSLRFRTHIVQDIDTFYQMKL
jgi:hypothetical protein